MLSYLLFGIFSIYLLKTRQHLEQKVVITDHVNPYKIAINMFYHKSHQGGMKWMATEFRYFGFLHPDSKWMHARDEIKEDSFCG